MREYHERFPLLIALSPLVSLEHAGEMRQKEAKIEECQKAWVSFPSLQVRQEKIWTFQFLARSFSALPTGKKVEEHIHQ